MPARPRGRTPTTWINGRIRKLYGELFELGHCHTVEAYLDGRLVGGLYGVDLAGAFFGESMFHRETDASKVALVHLVARLRPGGYRLLDTQFVTDHLLSLGASNYILGGLSSVAGQCPADRRQLPGLAKGRRRNNRRRDPRGTNEMIFVGNLGTLEDRHPRSIAAGGGAKHPE